MKSRNHFPLFQFCFGLMLMAVFFGWLVVILELVQRDAEIAEARVREAEEKALDLRVEKFEGYYPAAGRIASEQSVKELVLAGGISGVWSPTYAADEVGSGGVSSLPLEWKDVLRSDQLKGLSEELRWGRVEGGRDSFGSLVLRVAKSEGKEFQAVDVLEEGVWRYDAPAMSPGFRLILISELEKHRPSPELKRLRVAEEIRAVEGRVYELANDYEMVGSMDDLAYFYGEGQKPWPFNSEDIRLTETAPEDRAWVKVPGFRYWPYVSFVDDGPEEGAAVRQSKKAIYWVGSMTLISTIGLVWGAIWMGRRQLQQARARMDLAASVAHELRTPLAGQRVVLESMLTKEKFDEGYLKMALRENERLGDLAEEFLTFSRLERGVLELQLESLVLSESVESVVSDFCAQHSDEEVAFEGDGKVEALADSAGVATIVRNLLENAWKYSAKPRRIKVQVFERDREVGFSVADDGVGLSAVEQKRIFGQFYRVEQKLSRSQDGMGIGLSIVKRLVDAMEGRIEVESEKGKGSTFRVFLQKGGQV